jgi:CBS domain-containing protein
MIETGRDVAIAIGPGRAPVGILTAHDVVRVAPGLLPPGLDTRALATVPPITVHRHQGAGAALDTMRAHHLRHLVVVDGPEPWAVISWQDLVELGAAARRSLPLDGLGWPAVETVPVGSSLDDIAERMVAQKVGCLPVVDSRGHLTGIVTRSDVLTLLIAALG